MTDPRYFDAAHQSRLNLKQGFALAVFIAVLALYAISTAPDPIVVEGGVGFETCNLRENPGC